MSEFVGPSPMEQAGKEPVLIPRYEPSEQLRAGDLDTAYPAWRSEHPDADPELLLFDYVRTQTERELARATGIPLFVLQDSDEGLEKAVKQIPREVSSHFQAHGIAGKTGSSSGELDELLRGGIKADRHLYTMELGYVEDATVAHMLGAPMPKADGGLITVFEKDDEQGEKGIKYVIVGAKYVKCFDAMQARYPDVTFVPWHDAPQYFTDLVNSEDGTSHTLKEVAYPDAFEIGDNDELPGLATSRAVGAAALHPAVTLELGDDSDTPEVW